MQDSYSYLIKNSTYGNIRIYYDLRGKTHFGRYVQGLAKEGSLGCVKRAPVARGAQDAELTQPRDHYLANPCTSLLPGGVSPSKTHVKLLVQLNKSTEMH